VLEVSEQTGYDASTRPTPIKPLGLAVFFFSISQEIYALSKPNTPAECLRPFQCFHLFSGDFIPNPPGQGVTP